MFTVSFLGRKAPIYAKTKIKNARASELAASINKAYEKASKDNDRTIKPLRSVSGKSLTKINEDCFVLTTQRLSEKGLESFNSTFSKKINVSTESNLGQFIQGIREYINSNVDKHGKVYYLFDQFHQ